MPFNFRSESSIQRRLCGAKMSIGIVIPFQRRTACALKHVNEQNFVIFTNYNSAW